ncbi:hypothetical protein JRQ81_003404 [Phrynocephalus forsythii]|uniref:Uncharacterized protein n=1 Tax=Phrynocephalus forsythii TaxID=171643 RepID=A0A9Q0XK52_9SAUR|nr:hypothetical protein JRQ81_003404 [Phrynocephalus forsythii]
MWLLASSVFLCLTLGDAVMCRRCYTLRPWIPCTPEGGICAAVANEMLCMTLKVYKDFELWQKILSCTKIDDDRCDEWHIDDTSGRMFAYSCCSSKDFCNED